MFMKLVDVDPGPSPNIDKEGRTSTTTSASSAPSRSSSAPSPPPSESTYYVPNVIFETFAVKVPVWYLLNQEVFVTTICSGAIAYLNCFYR